MFLENSAQGSIDPFGLYGVIVSYERFINTIFTFNSRNPYEVRALLEDQQNFTFLGPFSVVRNRVAKAVLSPFSGGHFILSRAVEVTQNYAKAKVRYSRQDVGQRAADVILRDEMLGDQNGHIIGRQLGGWGDASNLFPQAGALNFGPFKAFEGKIRRYLDTNRCEEATLFVNLLHAGTLRPFRPQWIWYSAEFHDIVSGKSTYRMAPRQFLNR